VFQNIYKGNFTWEEVYKGRLTRSLCTL